MDKPYARFHFTDLATQAMWPGEFVSYFLISERKRKKMAMDVCHLSREIDFKNSTLGDELAVKCVTISIV